jgi:fatty acid desaturase
MIMRYAADWRSLSVVLLTLAVAFTLWLGCCTSPLLWCASVALMYVCFAINHNHQHVQMSTHRWINRLIDLALTLCQGLPATVIVYAHNIDHHTHNDSPEDVMGTRHVRARNHLARLLAYPAVAAWRYRIVGRTIAKDAERRNPAFARRVAWQRAFLIVAVAAMLALKPLATLAVFIGPWLAVHLWGLNSNFMQHEACDHRHPDDHSRNFTGRLFNWLLFSGGYHTIHHERPSLHWSLIPQAHAARADRIAPHLNIRSWAWWMVLYAFVPSRALRGPR